ncbi:ammonium transporter [Thermosulfuriphilus ammonigenes]|uniref:Ammonium transporter n=1 Tax=Thermosulfuriphilus ammonigenes TaxID=1936021 RepID=A0A6G7PUC9_9BACT|nr:ammonium transporter [Thermosulfuriphilus ammonigenes]MBA2848599.1 Amt family ammonium transporter [Thermosulfuriphilus ammonigenes]QIJ71262.1 ammonium transporter [Thermosulfuriphilus ammonigenes]
MKRRRLWTLVVWGSLALSGSLAWAGDPTGAQTLKSDPGLPVDYVWVLICGFMVMFMQAGFACVEAGFCRAKNVTNLFTKNVMDFVVGSLAFWALGYGIMMGTDWKGLLGTSGFFLSGDGYDVGNYLTFFWQMVFAATAATIVSGAVAERLKFQAYLVYSAVITLFIYPIYGHWVWGGGWLSKLPYGLGHLDFAGSGVVHAVGGFIGLAGAIVLGPRYGKFDKNGRPRAIPGHSLPMAALGTFILWFGWYGFNPGSTFSAHHLRISVIAVNTTLAASAASLTALLIILLKTRRFDLGMALNGALAGLVAITAPCAWVEAWAAAVIGIVAGFIVVAGVYLLEGLKIDDPVGAVPVHGFNGIWGLLAVGIFADGTYGNYSIEPPFVKGLLYGGGVDQFISQLIGAGALILWAFGCGLVLFKVLDSLMGIRVEPKEELMGLDIIEHGTPAYPEFYTMNSQT